VAARPVRAATRRWSGPASDPAPGLRQHAAQDLRPLVELGPAADERRGELDDRVPAVVGPAVEAGVEQRAGQEPAQQPLGLLGVEGLPGRPVLDQLDPVEVPVAADVADDRQVQPLLEGGPEGALLSSTRWSSPCSSNTSRLARATAQLTGCPPKVCPCAKDAVPLRNGSTIRSEAITAPMGE
jgi:hypothetical protein